MRLAAWRSALASEQLRHVDRSGIASQTDRHSKDTGRFACLLTPGSCERRLKFHVKKLIQYKQ